MLRNEDVQKKVREKHHLHMVDRLSPIGNYKKPNGEAKNRPLLIEQQIIKIFIIKRTLRRVREIYINSSKVDTNAHRISNTSAVLMIITVHYLVTVEVRQTDGGETSSRFTHSHFRSHY